MMYGLTKPQKLIYNMEKFSGGAIAMICGSALRDGYKDSSALKHAVNELYRLNSALRTRVVEENGEAMQTVSDFVERDVEVLHFADKVELDAYASEYAKQPLDIHGSLCELRAVQLPNKHGALIKLHHLVGDAWALSLLNTQLYAILDGETPSAHDYVEYIASEAEYLQSKRYGKDRAFFLEQFQKCEEATYLSDKQSDSLSSVRKTFVIDVEKSRLIYDYATTNHTSPYALFMAALSVYMNRIKMNTEKFYIGTAVLNRSGIREKNTVGMFVNTIPMLIELNNEQTFADNLSSIETTELAAFRHQKYNYGDVLADIRKEYGFNERLYDVLLSYQNAKIVGNGNAESTWYHSGVQVESLQIHIDDRDGEGFFKLQYDYQTAKFTKQEINGLHQHICNLLFDAITNDSKRLYELSLLTEDEQRKLLIAFNDTAVDYPKDKCVHELFEEQVIKTPDKAAVIACDKTLSYAELNAQANRIAHGLIAQGVTVGDIVAFMLPRTSYLFAVIFGILKAGAVFMPVDIDYPQDRIDYMLSDSKAKVCITDKNIEALLENDNTENPSMAVSSDSLCYCIYTSGSTGLPKGTLLTHRNAVNYVNNNDKNVVHKVVKSDYRRIICMAAVGFDMFITETLLSMTNGLEVVLANDEQSKFQTAFNALLQEFPVDVIQTTPTKMRLLTADKTQVDCLRAVKAFIIGGEVVDKAIVDELKQLTDAEIYNFYGPTECTVWATNGKVINTEDMTIGEPMANARIYIVDRYLQPVPLGVTGELCIAGDGVGAGYLNRPELTAEKFIDNPFGIGKLYKTGDLAYWREDGNIVYIGRNDFQVKIRGLRIELGEIENAISAIDGISQSAVIVRKDNTGRQLICAFYTGTELPAKEIRAIIGQKLPKYMLPHIFTHLDKMPLTSSGKISRKSLPEVDLSQITASAEYIEPEGELEIQLAALMEKVLNYSPIGRDDDFFDLGGDSLKAISLISSLESAGYHTDVKTVFANATVRALAPMLTPTVQQITPLEEITGDVPATPAQMRVYTAQAVQGGTAYNVPYAFRVESLNVEKLQGAIQVLVDRYEVFRTHFEERDGNIVQVVAPEIVFKVEKLESDDIAAFIRPFDLSKAPLLRVGYCGNTVMIDMHHIITDGGSLPVFFRELNELYMGRELKEPVIQYRQFAVHPQDYSDSEAYWLSIYSDELPELELNTDYKRGQKLNYNGNALYASIDTELHQRITDESRKLGITPFVFYMGGFYILLSKFSGNEDIIVGMPVSGRKGANLEALGMFVNTVALRGKPAGTKQVREFLKEIRQTAIDAIAYQDYPFGDLVKKLNINTPNRNPMFDVMFAYQDVAMTDIVFGDEKVELLPVPIMTVKDDFTFNIMPRQDDVVVLVEYCTDLYLEKTIQRFVDGYQLVLEQMLDADQPIKAISAISEQERQKLLIAFNDTAVEYPKDKCVHELVEEQAARTPDKTAVIACDRTLTYAELNAQANRIAHGLITQGVTVGDIVAFMLPRTSNIIATMLGILKAGAAYLPIDPDYPQDRIDYILSDSTAKVCITDKNIEALLENNNTKNPSVAVPDNSLCYCIYTSGSTGLPKGTLLTHRNVANYVNDNKINVVHSIIKHNYQRIVSVTTIGFDIFVTESLMPLVNGIEIVLADEGQSNLQSSLNSLLSVHQADVLQTTPTKMKALIIDKKQIEYLREIKAIILGGEALDKALIDELSQITSAEIFNIYGPTETTVWSTNKKIVNVDDITIGKPIANTQIYIVDRYLQPVPLGVTGELCIAGDGVGAGYLNRPELTAEKFIDNPFGTGKLYKTGDLAYWREDGNIVYIGRNDFQVKIRGLRIELGEIENAISAIDEISQSTVIVRKDDTGRQLICAFYTGTELPAKEIRAKIGQKLPRYMLPHIFTHLDKMPLTSSGKINRKALPEVDLSQITASTEYIEPEGELETQLAALMEKVLNYSPIGRDDDFFDLGGDSLKAIQFASMAHNDGIYFTLQRIFDHPTVRRLAECIKDGDKQQVSYDDMDFTDINKILSKNTVEYIQMPRAIPVGNLLLSGATGFLGAHILSEYLEHDEGIAYCLVRGKDRADSERRLAERLNFYFGKKYDNCQRIRVICADLQQERFGLSEREYQDLLPHVDTVINAAATVKHYGSYSYFYEVNVETVQRLIDFCLSCGAKLIQISTTGVSGNNFNEGFGGTLDSTERHFDESSLYIGQPLDNVYVRSKFEAEIAVLNAMNRGLRANIMRMGNLTNRSSDGVFQPNYDTNAFLKRFKAFLGLGMFPDYLVDGSVEFTPIDEAAHAVMTIARHFSMEQTVFHVENSNLTPLRELIAYLNELGYAIKEVGSKAFSDALVQVAKQKENKYIFETFISEMDSENRLVFNNTHVETGFTARYLHQLGFEWPAIDMEYIKKYMGYFEKIWYWEV